MYRRWGRFLFGLSIIWAQRYTYGNEWIEDGVSYRKLLVWRDGVYRVTAGALGITAPSATLRLFWRGQTVPIYVADGGDGVFNGSDYIEFIGRRNDGEPDSVVFRHNLLLRHQPGIHGNPLMPLNHNDTSAYFLCWGVGTGLHIEPYTDPDPFSHPVQDWFWWRFTESAHTGGYWFGPGGFGVGGYEQHNNPMYILGEGRGWGLNPLVRSYALPSPRPEAAPFFVVELSHASLSIGGTFSLEWQVNGYTTQAFTAAAPYYFRPRFTVPTSVLAPSVTVSCISSTAGYSGEFFHYCSVVYPRSAVLSASDTFLTIGVVNPSPTPRVLVLSGMPVSAGDSVLVYDIQHRRRWRAVWQAGQWYVPLPALADTFSLYIVRGQSIGTPLIRSAIIENYSEAAGAEILLVTHRRLAASAQAYKEYRETHPINPRSVLIAYTDAIDDEFGWGRVGHPLAIRNLVRWGLDHWTTPPKYLLLWGDGVGLWRLGYGDPPPPYHLVPVFGYPASDWGYVSDFYGEGDIVPTIPVGRIPAQNDNHGYIYIDKLRTYESMTNPPWLKWALHLGGGENAIEQSLISSHLLACQQVFEDSIYQGRVVYYQKRTGGMQAPPGSPTIKERIDSGVVILQTFGHSGAELFDVNFYEPVDYDNWGRYPLIIVNGCYQGNFDEIDILSQIHSERFIFEGGRGCLWYLSLSGTGFIGALGRQTLFMYEVFFRDSVGIMVGNGLVEAFRRIHSSGMGAFEYYHMAGQPLLGDPCVRLAAPTRPDLAISSADVRVIPAIPSAEENTFRVFIRYQNLGIGFVDSFSIRVTHRIVSSGQSFTYTYRRGPFLRQDSLEVVLFAPASEWAGINELEVFVDALDEISNELREDNNKVRLEFLVRSARPLPLYPWPFAVINKDSIALIAATYNQNTSAPQGYYFEIDTSYRFDSPFLRQSGLVQGTTVFGRWELPFRLKDSVVYYWRVRLEGAGSQEWATQSFQYIRGPREGWGQSARPQFLENELVGLRYEAPHFEWSFTQQRVKIEARDSYSPLGPRRFLQKDGAMLSTIYSHTLYAGWWDGAFQPGVFIAVFDPTTFEPLERDEIFGEWRYFCSGFCYQRYTPVYYFVSMTTDAMIDSLWAVIQRAPIGAPVLLLFTAGHTPSTWSSRITQILSAIGASNNALNLTPTTKGLVLGAKGAPPATALENFCPDTASCAIEKVYEIVLPRGWMFSPRIPRPVQWEEAFFEYQRRSSGDTISLFIYGIRPDETVDTLYRDGLSSQVYDLRPYNASYANLRLSARYWNRQSTATPQLLYWYVLFQPFPDIAIDPTLRWVLERERVEEGEEIALEIGLRNLLSARTPDSIEVLYLIQTASGSWDTLGWQRYPPLEGLDTLVARFRFSSIGFGGANRLRIIANPRPLFGERTFVNNRWEAEVFVATDRINPVVDVLFDGHRIQNGDIVAPDPIITIEVKDENRHLALDDTSTVIVRLRKGDERGLGERISYNSGKLRFTPATLPENRAQVEFRPGPLADGEYVLSVEAFDKKRNRSGLQPYEIRFRIINESSLTYVLNYPNPFSTSTRFYYELTGGILPEVFQIHIYTLSGRLVKVIDLKALGEVRIGRHLTRYAWDGTDEYGDRLANGVYLYRVVLRMPNNQKIEQRSENLSEFFKGGWGKMVLLR
ncbi:MAG: C25 family cysteine peptidase [Bacteroidia bacterium]|nr:C25 family cysteine peptidase [Bacteroidia bacterium]MDW8016078.1 C25 family cysteine peptidase [Bacteroidia bacterium]